MWQSVVSSGKEERFAFERQGSRVVESLESRECVVFLRYSTGARDPMASCSCLSFLGLHALANREFSMQQIFNTPQQMHDKLCCEKGCPCTDMRVQEHE